LLISTFNPSRLRSISRPAACARYTSARTSLRPRESQMLMRRPAPRRIFSSP
jgi:hypothetical protein